MREAGSERVGGCAVPEIPETVGDGAGRIVGECNRYRVEAAGWVAGKTRHRDESAGADDLVGQITASAGESDDVGKANSTSGRKGDDKVRSAKTGQREWRAGDDAETRTCAQSGRAVR